MTQHTPAIRKGQKIQARYGRKMIDAVAIDDSRMAPDVIYGTVEMVRYRYNPSGRTPCPDWHTCDGLVSSFVVIDEDGAPRRAATAA